MKRLPNEILQKIFLLLHQQEKVKCMLTCQNWAAFIKRNCLFNTIQLSEMSNWTELLSNIEPLYRNQVECLILNFYLEGDFAYLFSFFPKLRVFYVLGCHNLVGSCLLLPKENCYLEYLTEAFSHELTCNLLQSNSSYSQLKTLNIKASKFHISAQSVITLLHHAPNLLQLTMKSFIISIDDLELLHKCVSSLYSIKLLESTISTNDILSHSISPTSSVKVFSLETPGASSQLQRQWLHYINTKYTGLLDLTLYFPVIWNQQQQRQQYLESIRINNTEGFGSQLKSLSLKMNNSGPDLFRMFDERGCQIEKLNISLELQENVLLYSFIQSNQVKYVHTLKIEALPSSDYRFLMELPLLRKLTLKKAKNLQLTKLLEISGNTIESLSIHNSDIETIDVDCSHIYKSIKSLGFLYQTLPHRMDHFISKSFPNLHNLSFIHCGLKTFHLPNHRLSILEIAEGVLFKETHLLLITEKEKRWYTAKQYYSHYQHLKKQNIKNISAYLTAKSTIFNDSIADTSTATLIFKCMSVNTLYIFR